MATQYPISVYHFEVKWGGSRVGFTEVSGLDFEVQPIDYREGSDTQYHVSKMPGIPKFGNLTMKRGMLDGDNEFHQWLGTIQLNQVDRRTLTISLLDEQHQPVSTWQAVDCFPCKVTGPQLKSTGNEVAMESIEICHEGLVKLL